MTEPLKEQILKGDVHTIEEMKAWLQPFGYSDAIKNATINFILREFVMSKVSCDDKKHRSPFRAQAPRAIPKP